MVSCLANLGFSRELIKALWSMARRIEQRK
jgi:hypothetical protein